MKGTSIFRLLGVWALAGVASAAAPQIQTGQGAETTFDGLTRVDNTIMDAVWVRPDIDLRSFRKVLFVPVGVSYRDVEPSDPTTALRRSTRSRTTELREFQLDEETKALFEAEIGAAFSEEVAASEVYEVVDEAGPDVLQIGVALLDVVSRVPPQAATQPRVYIESVGEATLVLEIRGSMSNSIYLRAVDRRAAARQSEMIESNRVTNASEIRRLGRRWGEIVRKGLETLLAEGAGT
jgi:hypothetical protein